jgi:hypothetical protein
MAPRTRDTIPSLPSELFPRAPESPIDADKTYDEFDGMTFALEDEKLEE